MTRLDRHLLIVVGLVVLTALALMVPRGYARPVAGRPLDDLSAQLGAWRTTGGDAHDILPPDARSLESISRVYATDSRRLWLSVASYTGENGPQARPSLEGLVTTHGATALARDSVSIAVGDPTRRLQAGRIAVRLSGHTITTWYWYELGERTIGNEYALRFWLALNTALGRRERLVLVRVATTDDTVPQDFVGLLLAELRHRTSVGTPEPPPPHGRS